MAGCDFNPIWFWTSDNIKAVLKLLPELDKPLFHICSGVSNIGYVKLDRSYIITKSPKWNQGVKGQIRGMCDVKGDMNNLPVRSSVAGSIICDPPYKYDFTKPELISELVRICKPGGKIIFIAPWIPNHKNLSVISTDLWNVGKNGAYFKIRTLFFKSGSQLEDF